MTTGDGDDLLRLAFQYQRHEKVEEMNVAGDIGLEQLICNVVKLLVLFAPVEQRSLTSGSKQREVDLQFTNRGISVELGGETCVADKVVNATLANNLGSLVRGLLQAVVVGEVSMEDVDVGTLAQFFRHLLFRGRLVADQTDDQVLLVFGDALEEAILDQIRRKSRATRQADSRRFRWTRR